ncbi:MULTISPECIES: D-alanine--D-alanine ligase [Thalassolituus]|jgi:D-alanine-D-alanine ligase|uniref:D-alanine--D-alanine ligase n=1 Tax=Thalassolituus TaxID=187492 RepID=UPI001E4DAE24|nr:MULTISPECIES: D-alanine--D-alanine ligase [Thalassolituus]MCB2386940.1 D-alanine--D-alanine ligase [Thalassolituus alkanivorans]MCB2423502.1 D-alanine--D-alanine ligase [Thalassolituus alkanivorans]
MNVAALGKIAVLMGGTSAERAVSLKSGQAVYTALQQSGADVIAIDVQAHAIEQLTNVDFDVAFIALHGRGGEDGTIQGVLEWLNKPYTGSGVMASALAMDKWRTKLIWQAAGLPTPKAFLLNENSDWSQLIAELNADAIVKPAREGSSIGMRKVHTAEELQNSFDFAREYDGLVLAESWVKGAEFTVAIVDGKALPAIQLKTSHAFYDYDAKYQANDTQYLLPCGLSAEKEQELQQLALKAFDVIGGQGWGRIDVMQDQNEQFWLLEANTSPGMTDHSLVPMAAAAVGMSFSELVVHLLTEARERIRG